MRNRFFAAVKNAAHHNDEKTTVILTASEIRQIAKLPEDEDRAEVRLYAAAFTIVFMALLIFPAMSILSDVDAPITRVAGLCHASELVAALFLLGAAASAPYLCCLMFKPCFLKVQWPRQLAAAGTSLAALLWCFLAGLSDPLDMPAITVIYWVEAFLCGGLGFLYGFSLNAQQVRSNDKPHIAHIG